MSGRTYAGQKAALTRALKKPEGEERQRAVVAEVKRVKKEWGNAWPDDWSRWQRALSDVFSWDSVPQMDDL